MDGFPDFDPFRVLNRAPTWDTEVEVDTGIDEPETVTTRDGKGTGTQDEKANRNETGQTKTADRNEPEDDDDEWEAEDEVLTSELDSVFSKARRASVDGLRKLGEYEFRAARYVYDSASKIAAGVPDEERTPTQTLYDRASEAYEETEKEKARIARSTASAVYNHPATPVVVGLGVGLAAGAPAAFTGPLLPTISLAGYSLAAGGVAAPVVRYASNRAPALPALPDIPAAIAKAFNQLRSLIPNIPSFPGLPGLPDLQGGLWRIAYVIGGAGVVYFFVMYGSQSTSRLVLVGAAAYYMATR